MYLKPNKPYVWVDQSGADPIIQIIVRLEEGRGINPDGVETQEQDGTLYLKYTTDEYSGTFEDNPLTFNLQSYNDVDRVVVEIHQDNNMLGFQVVKPRDGIFAPSGATPNPVPYCYLEFRNTGELLLHLAIYLPESATMNGYRTDEDEPNFKQMVNLLFKKNTDGPPGWHYSEIPLNESSGYDPILEDIIVEVIVADDENGTNEKKGHGTTHGSEGDASGNG